MEVYFMFVIQDISRPPTSDGLELDPPKMGSYGQKVLIGKVFGVFQQDIK